MSPLQIVSYILIGVQVLFAVALTLLIAFQTTKSESGGAAGMGWGAIGGQVSSTISKFGKEAQLTRLTTWVAVIFFVLCVLSAWVHTLLA